MHSRTILYFIIGIFLSGTAKSQQDNSFNFQSDGANGDFVTVSSNALIQPTTGMTLEAWVKPTEDPATYNMNGIVSYLTLDGPTLEAGFAFIYNSGEWRFIVMTGDNDVMPNIDSWPGIDIPFNGSTWTHIAGTYDGTTAKIFKNGIEEGSFNAPNDGGNIVWDDINHDFYIAKYQENYFKGSIDEVRLWEIVRTEAEIQAAMNDSITDDPVGLLGYWNFNDNQSNTIVDHTFNGVPGTLTNNGTGTWDTDVFLCEDFIIELPYNSAENSEDPGSTDGQGDGWYNNWGAGQSEDVAYKLTLDEQRTLYIDTCDSLTAFDTMLAIKSSCYEQSSLYEIDDRTGDNACVGSGTIDTYPATFEGLTLAPGTYYIIVEGFNSAVGSYGLAIGAVPEIIGSSIASDDSYIEILFNDPIYTTNEGTGAANLADFQIEFNPNGGNATNVAISTLTNTSGGGLVGGEDTIRINIAVTPNGQSSGVETVTITPTDGSSLFNSTGIAVSDSSTVTQQLNDYFPPNVNFFPENDTINPSQDIVIQFNEPIRLINNTDVDSNNIQDLFTLVYADTGTNSIDFVASVDDDNQQFTLNPDLSLQQRRTIATSFADNIFEDLGNNAIPTNSATFIVRDVTAATVTSDSLEQANQYIFLTISEGVYTNASGTGGLNTNDFEISSFTPGNATSANITSIASELGAILNGGETEVRLTLQFDNDPGGTESLTIRPKANEVFDDFGNPMDVNVNAITFTLYDALAPSVSFDPENNSLIYPNEVFTLTISEDVQLLNDSPVNSTNIDSQLTVAYIDGSAENISFSATIENNVITITPGSDLGEVRQVRVSILDGLEDLSNNQMDIHTAEYTVRDISPPEINTTFSSIITSNAFVILSFSENVYTNDNGTGALEISDFLLDFADNGGNATAATISDLQRPGPSGPLLGSEDSIWVYLSITGTPSGDETIVIQSNGNEAIYDGSGNPLSSPNNSTSTITLNPYPRLTDDSLDEENGYVDLVFSEGVFSTSDSSSAVETEDFILSFSQNGGNAIDATIITLTKTNGAPLSGGESTIRAVFSLSSPPASGVETIQITPVNAYAVCNSLGNRLSMSDCTVDLTLFDRLPPDITDAIMTADTIVSISVSEGMFNNEFGTGAVSVEDFHLEFYANNGNATNAQFINVSNTSQGPLTGGETTILIGFVTDLLPSGSEEIALSPASSSSIYDPAGNPMPVTMISARVTLSDRLPPMIIAPTSSISNDNTYVIFTLTEGVYGSNEVTTPVEPNDFVVELIQNGGNATGAEVDYITNSRQFPVVGGEDTLRCYLAIQGTPSGHERLYIRATNDNSVFDGAGNGLQVSYPTDTLQLFDQLVPTVDSISIAHGSAISSSIASPINITFSEPIQSFGYSVSARHYNYLSYITDTTATGFKITFQPPMASLDTITLSIFDLMDSVGLEAVDFSYEFYTPPLGDYDIDGRVNVEDLTQFVSFWMADSQPLVLGLGPTSGTFPHLVPELDLNYDLDDGMTFIRMWSWSLERFGLEPLVSPNIGIPINWDKLVVDVPMEAIAGQVYLRYNPNQGKVDLQHTAFGNNNFTLKKELVDHGEVLLEFGLVEPNDDTKIISIKSEIDEPADATVIYKFFAKDHSLIAAGTQKIALVIPTEFRLMQNYPNPFNNTTTIRYAVPEETDIQLEIFDISGRLVETLTSQLHQPGFYDLKWSGRQIASGIYFIKLEAAKTVLTQKMILLK